MRVFADTYFYLALFNTRDAHHRRVVESMTGFSGGVVTTRWVLTEVADAFASIPQRRQLQAKFQVLADLRSVRRLLNLRRLRNFTCRK